MITLTLAHSADADDVFMWWPLTGKVDPKEPSRILEAPLLETGGIRFVSVPEDIQALNLRAIERGDLDITAVSFATLPHIWARYRPTICGSSFGDNWGPKLVCKTSEAARFAAIKQLGGGTLPRATLVIPGRNTTAWLTLNTLLGAAQIRESFTILERPFDQIVATVSSGEADLGLLIHESQLTFQDHGLSALLDLGVAFKSARSMPLPLGANAVRIDLDARFGPGTLQRTVDLLDRSVRTSLERRGESLAYARTFSPLKDDATLDRYINLYVNPWTVSADGAGEAAARLLLATGAGMGLLPPISDFAMLRPSR